MTEILVVLLGLIALALSIAVVYILHVSKKVLTSQNKLLEQVARAIGRTVPDLKTSEENDE